MTLDTLLRAYPACLAFHGETGSYLALLDQVTSGRLLLRIDCGETDGMKAKKNGVRYQRRRRSTAAVCWREAGGLGGGDGGVPHGQRWMHA